MILPNDASRCEGNEIEHLHSAVKDWVDARNAPVTGMFGIAERDALIKAEDALERAYRCIWKMEMFK